MEKQYKLGIHRGSSRLWIESGRLLRAAGFVPGARFNIKLKLRGVWTLEVDENGSNKVSERRGRPIIDIKLASDAPSVLVSTGDGKLLVVEMGE